MVQGIGVALIGSGIFMRERHLPAVLACPQFQIKAIYSRTSKSATALLALIPSPSLQSEITIYADDLPESQYTHLLTRTDIPAFLLALPITSQTPFTRLALESGKHVLAEKPLALNLDTATTLLNHHRTLFPSTATLSIAEQWRFIRAFSHAATLARTLGAIRTVSLVFGTEIARDNKYAQTAWRQDPTLAGGFLLDGGVHFVAALRVLLGRETRVVGLSAVTQKVLEWLPVEDTVMAVLRLSNGGTGSVVMSFGLKREENVWEVVCERGTVRVVGDVVTVVTGEGKKEETVLTEGSSVQCEVDAWAESMVKGCEDARLSAEEALADLELIEAMLVSGEQHGQPIELAYQQS